VRVEPQHLLSLSRVVLGAVVLAQLPAATSRSYLVLAAVLLACAADAYDGMLARRRGGESTAGRLLDNLCDAAFLALAFTGFARAAVWSNPMFGSATHYWHGSNWLPLIGLVLSFGTYLLRWALAALRGAAPVRSARGHHAGVLNYVLAVAGGVAVLPGVAVTPWLLEPLSVAIALFNAMAAWDNVLLLFGGGARSAGPAAGRPETAGRKRNPR
jgi:phosphatidylglycerophosphate synthase